jgi:hypothetical protein
MCLGLRDICESHIQECIVEQASCLVMPLTWVLVSAVAKKMQPVASCSSLSGAKSRQDCDDFDSCCIWLSRY